jgi:hypothetical protein
MAADFKEERFEECDSSPPENPRSIFERVGKFYDIWIPDGVQGKDFYAAHFMGPRMGYLDVAMGIKSATSLGYFERTTDITSLTNDMRRPDLVETGNTNENFQAWIRRVVSSRLITFAGMKTLPIYDIPISSLQSREEELILEDLLVADEQTMDHKDTRKYFLPPNSALIGIY